MTVALESDGIEIAVPADAKTAEAPGTVKLRLVNRAVPETANSDATLDPDGSGVQPHRKRRRSANSGPRTYRQRRRRNLPRKDTPGHAGLTPRGQRTRHQRLPRETKPTSQQRQDPREKSGTDAGIFAWQGVSALGGESNYFLGNDPARWRTHVKHYAAAEAENVLPGVDMEAYGNAEGVEYDLRIAPEVDARGLRLEVGGADAMRLDASGDVILTVGGREMRMKMPAIYEEWTATASRAARRKQIAGGYALTADGAIAFHMSPHDPGATLVVDPSLTVAYTTFLGGAGADSATSIALDATGKVYIGGTTTSAETFPELGGVKVGPTGGADYFIAKIDPTQAGASSLVYLTFIGGSGSEAGGEIAVDSSGNAAIAGTSTSVDYPVTDGSSLTAGMNGATVNDTAVTEIGPSGATLVYSTLFGGDGNEGSLSTGGIAMDSAGDIYVAMDTRSSNLTVAPAVSTTVAGPFQPVFSGGSTDGFLAEFQPVVSGATPHLKYCTYLGIYAEATVTGVAVDSVGNAYLAGYTSDPTGTLVTTNGFQTTYAGDPSDGFVMKILPSGNGAADLSYGTFLGGGGMDQALAIAVSAELPGTVYVTGTTQSTNFPGANTVPEAIAGYQTALKGTANAFLAAIGQNGAGTTSLLYSTYLGGGQSDAGLSVWFAEADQIYVSGRTTSVDFPAQYNFQPFTGGQDAFVAELDPTMAGGASLIFSTPLGGTSPPETGANSLGNGIAVDGNGNVYVAGATTSGDFPLAGQSDTGLQTTCSSCQQTPGVSDAFLVEIAPSTASLASVSFSVGKVNFGTQAVGSLGIPPQVVAVKNTGDAPLDISSVTLTGPNSADFSLQNPIACTDAPIAVGSTCSFEVGFVPSLVGPETAFVTFADDAPPKSQVLEAVGVGGGPLAVVSPASINFGSQPEGTVSSSAQYVTLTNAGNQPLTISNVLLPSGANAAQFPVLSTATPCAPGPLAAGASCELAFYFAPTTNGVVSAEVGFVDNSSFLAGSQQVLTLTGTGTGMAPLLSVTPAALSFGTQPVGVTSGFQTVTVANVGSAQLNLTSIAVTGSNSTNFGFYVKGTSPCPYPSGALAAGTSCTISVDFMPQGNGPVSATLAISDNAAGSPQSVALSGTGGTAGISVAPTSLNFASQTIGAASTAQVVNISNTGTSAVAMTISIGGTNPGDFAETDNCSQSPLGGGKSCVMNVTFAPTQTGNRSAVLQIFDDAPRSPQVVTLSGAAVQAAATITPTGAINFGSVLAGTASTPVTVTITNSGTAPAVLTVASASVTDAADFTAKNNCNAGVPAAGNCTLALTFTPAALAATAPCGSSAGTKTATLAITDNAATSPQSIALSGTTMDYCLATSGNASQTVTAGSPATYNLVADSLKGFTGMVNLSCVEATGTIPCTVQPASLNVTTGAPVPFTVSATTIAASAAPYDGVPGERGRDEAARSVGYVLVLLLVPVLLWVSAGERELAHGMRIAQTGAMAVLLSVGLAACFGSGGGAAAVTGTPAGTYTLTVTATATGAVTASGANPTRTFTLTLVVQ
ncbi:MAG: choice-of-anchor D domain-containing protein [Candidatus Acidiferrales bacterium]